MLTEARDWEDLMVVLPDEATVRSAAPDLAALAAIMCRGIILTARGVEEDFVSRFFSPRYGILEDPVTGSAHCALAPFWTDRLGKTPLVARQVSKRGGELRCRALNDRVYIAGRATLYLTGVISLPRINPCWNCRSQVAMRCCVHSRTALHRVFPGIRTV